MVCLYYLRFVPRALLQLPHAVGSVPVFWFCILSGIKIRLMRKENSFIGSWRHSGFIKQFRNLPLFFCIILNSHHPQTSCIMMDLKAQINWWNPCLIFLTFSGQDIRLKLLLKSISCVTVVCCPLCPRLTVATEDLGQCVIRLLAGNGRVRWDTHHSSRRVTALPVASLHVEPLHFMGIPTQLVSFVVPTSPKFVSHRPITFAGSRQLQRSVTRLSTSRLGKFLKNLAE